MPKRVLAGIRRKASRCAIAVLVLGAAAAGVSAKVGGEPEAPIGIVSAVGLEQAPILAAMRVTRIEQIGGYRFFVGTIDGRPVVDVFGGELDESTELASYLLITHFHPRAMLFSGTAGAQAPSINVGDVVLSGFVVDKASIHYRIGGYQTPYKGVEVHARPGSVRGAVIAGYDHPLPTPGDAGRFGAGPSRPNRSWEYVTAFAGNRQLDTIAARTPKLGGKLLTGVIGEAPVWTTPLSWVAAENSLYETDAEENEGSGFAFACATEGVPALLIRGISDTPWVPNAYDGVLAARRAANVARFVVGQLPETVSSRPVRFHDLSRATNARTAGYMIASRADYRVGPVTGITYKAADGATRSLTPAALARFHREYRYGAANP